jgi:hypothetical protein
MRERLFREGGRYKVRQTGRSEYSMSIPLPTDADGRMARVCPSQACSPGYFKVTPGTGIVGGQTIVYCPYCRGEAEPSDYLTESQMRFAKDVMMREAHEGIGRMVNEALGVGASGRRTLGGGLIKIDLTVKQNGRPMVHRPFHEALQRAVICPNCGLDHAVFGLAVWCSDCGQDIFLTHVNAELNVVKSMLSDVGRRRNDLGPRVAARDIENCLEDAVSIYEAVFRALFSRCLRARGITEIELQSILAKKIANKFQNVRFSGEIVERELGLNPFEGIGEQPLQELIHTFEKRHAITHNLGVVDRKYLERMRSAEREGREVMVSPSEITKAIETTIEVIANLHRRLFGVKQAVAQS